MMKCIATLESSCSKYKIKRSRGDELQKWRQNTRSVVVGVFFGLGQVHFGARARALEHLARHSAAEDQQAGTVYAWEPRESWRLRPVEAESAS